MIYVASPYTDKNEEVMQLRYNLVVEFCARAMQEGHNVFSPIVHCHPLAISYDLPRDFTYWTNWNIEIMKACKQIWLVKFHGFVNSIGMKVDEAIATALGIRKSFIDPATFFCKKGVSNV